MISNFNDMDGGKDYADENAIIKDEITKALINAGFENTHLKIKIGSGGSGLVSTEEFKLLTNATEEIALALRETNKSLINLENGLNASTRVLLNELRLMQYEIAELKIPWYKKFFRKIMTYVS